MDVTAVCSWHDRSGHHSELVPGLSESSGDFPNGEWAAFAEQSSAATDPSHGGFHNADRSDVGSRHRSTAYPGSDGPGRELALNIVGPEGSR